MKTITKLISGAFAATLVVGVLTATGAVGDIFVSDVANNVIHKLAPDGTEYALFATGLATPEALAFDSAGNLFEADLGSGRILKFTPDGTQSIFASGLNVPYGLPSIVRVIFSKPTTAAARSTNLLPMGRGPSSPRERAV